jgi:hypothetical protein
MLDKTKLNQGFTAIRKYGLTFLNELQWCLVNTIYEVNRQPISSPQPNRLCQLQGRLSLINTNDIELEYKLT